MVKSYRSILEKKGWNEKEIQKVTSVLDKQREHDAFFSRIIFYSALLVIIFANVFVSFSVLFLSVALSSWLLYLVVTVLALTIGFLYSYLITDIGHLERRHHLFAGVIIPLIAIGNIILIAVVGNKIILDLGLNTGRHNPWILGIVFGFMFLVPSLIDNFISKN